ncbi:MAG: class II aldolase/adducin family protein [Syntrophomonadaceae bacterium]|nr:class II aldolase/adducin family protein [Syntrophomonadaceae bacterium]
MIYEQHRAQLIGVMREMADSGLVIGTWGNASCRADQHILITPSGMDYMMMQPEDLALLDMDGAVAAGKWRPSVESPLHLAIYRARPEVRAIVHVHSVNASAFAVANQAIPVVLEEMAQIIGHPVVTAAYARCGSARLAAAVLSALGAQGQAVLLANHGQLTLGRNLPEALKRARIVEKSAEVTLKAQALGAIHPLSPEVVNDLRAAFKDYGVKEVQP